MDILYHIGELATAHGASPLAGEAQGAITRRHDAFVAMENGRILAVGTGAVPPAPGNAATLVDCQGGLVTAGLVDCHTHLVFGGWRENELARKLRGESYLDILASGGGILSTVRQTRRMDEDALYARAASLLAEMTAHGTTALEAKSGYGLDLDTERKQLRVVRRLQQTHNPDIAPTFLGAHAVPPEYAGDTDAYTAYVCDHVLPAIAAEGLARYCDVFCETGVFTAAQTHRILSRAQALGLSAKVHIDEIDRIGGARVAGELRAVTADHLAVTDEAGMDQLKAGGVIAVLLPATSFYLDKGYAPARAFIERGVPVAVASDFNPGSTPNLSLQTAMTLACCRMHMTPEEVLTAVTLNAAAGAGMADRLGTVEVGKQADLVVWDVENLEQLLYRYGSNRVRSVYKNGARVDRRTS